MNMALRILLALLCSIFIFLFVYNDFAFYKEPIGKITHIDNKKNNQTVTLKLKNTKQKDKIFKIDNKFDSSGVREDHQAVGGHAREASGYEDCCAQPGNNARRDGEAGHHHRAGPRRRATQQRPHYEIGRASCRERV